MIYKSPALFSITESVALWYIFKSDDGSGGYTTYMYLDGSITETRFTKPTRHDDGVIAKFGNGNDLNIYHDGSNSYIKDLGTGTLNIQGSSVLNIGGTNGEIGFQYTENAGVALRHNNIVKLSTESTGVTVTGDLTVTGKVTAQEFHTEFVSASIMYESGSTKFGDTSDDNHDFTGSLNVLNGNLTVEGTGVRQINLESSNSEVRLGLKGNNGNQFRFTSDGTYFRLKDAT